MSSEDICRKGILGDFKIFTHQFDGNKLMQCPLKHINLLCLYVVMSFSVSRPQKAWIFSNHHALMVEYDL